MTTPEQDAGMIAYQNQDYATALVEWTKLAEQDHPQACHNIAILYENGEGVEQSAEMAQQWCEKSAKLGNVPAQTHLGYLLMHAQQSEQAVQWWQQAAQAGDADAQYFLGQAYHNGDGVAQDDDEAADWFEAAALQNHAGAQFNLGVLYANGQRFAHARHWWQKAADLGDANAQAALQQLNEMGV